jgi:hypothetical protein
VQRGGDVVGRRGVKVEKGVAVAEVQIGQPARVPVAGGELSADSVDANEVVRSVGDIFPIQVTSHPWGEGDASKAQERRERASVEGAETGTACHAISGKNG